MLRTPRNDEGESGCSRPSLTAAGLAQAHGRAEPQFEALLGAVRRRGEAVQAVTEGDILAGGHGQVADLEADRSVEAGESTEQVKAKQAELLLPAIPALPRLENVAQPGSYRSS